MTFSYVRTWTLVPLLIALPVLMVPESAVLDFVLWGAPAWRTASDLVHAAAAVLCIALVVGAYRRPHRCDADRVCLRFSYFAALDVARDRIAAVTARGELDPKAARRDRATRRDTFAVVLEGVPTVQVDLSEPVVTHGLLGRTRTVRRVLVPVDDPRAFVAALTSAAPDAPRAPSRTSGPTGA